MYLLKVDVSDKVFIFICKHTAEPCVPCKPGLPLSPLLPLKGKVAEKNNNEIE